ncbi:MAG TPA: tetratricopeptide repeat protein [Pyrinomonadaceae bacterium]
MRKFSLAFGFILLTLFAASAQTAPDRLKQREAEWKNCPLPATNFTRKVAPGKQFIFRVPSDWKQQGEALTFNGPHSAVLRLVAEEIPNGFPLTDYVAALMRAINSVPGARQPPLTRQTQFQDLEAREVIFESPDPEGEMVRSTSWVTVVGPTAVTINLQVPVANVTEAEPYFKALIQSVVFPRTLDVKHTEEFREKIKSTDAPVNEVQILVNKINELNAVRGPLIKRLTEIATANPDQPVDLLIDRRPLVRAAAVEAIAGSNNPLLADWLWEEVNDPEPLVSEAAAKKVATASDVLAQLAEHSISGFRTNYIARVWPWLTKERQVELLKAIFEQSAHAPASPPPPARKAPRSEITVSVKQLEPVVPGRAPKPISSWRSEDPNVQLGALILMLDLPFEDFRLPLTRLIQANYDPMLIVGLQVANKRAEPLDLTSLLKLAQSTNAEVAKRALQNLRYSAGVSDIPRLELLRPKTSATSKLTIKSADLDLTIKAIRFRDELENAKRTGAALDGIIKKGIEDRSLADFAWQITRPPVDLKSIPKRDVAIQPLAENLLPNRVSQYTAILKPSEAVQKFYESLNGIQMDSARAQSNLFLTMGGFRQAIGQQLNAPPDAEALIDYSGIKPDAPIVFSEWTTPGANEQLVSARRRAIVLRINDRERFERTLNTYEKGVGDFTGLTGYVAGVTRLIAALPALLPYSAQKFATIGPPDQSNGPLLNCTSTYSLNWQGLEIKVFEKRGLSTDWQITTSATYIAYEGDTAIIAPSLATITDLLSHTGTDADKDHLGTNEEFRQVAAKGGEAIYFSDLKSLFAALLGDASDIPALKESGNLRILPASWENAHHLVLSDSEWSKDLKEFSPKDLTAPRDLLPASTVAYYFMSLDPANSWDTFAKSFFGKEAELSSSFQGEFKKDILAELGPECGVALLQMPELDNLDRLGWTGFCRLKTTKLADALTSGKLLNSAKATDGVFEIKNGESTYYVATKNNFFVISNRRDGITGLEAKNNLASTRDYSSAAEKVPGGVVAFGGYNLEAAEAAVKLNNDNGEKAVVADVIFSLARAFHSQNFYATTKPGALEAYSSVSMDRQGRYSVSALSYSPRGTNISYATLEPHGVTIADQKHITNLVIKISSKAAGPIENIREDISINGQTVEEKSPTELLLTIGARHPGTEAKLQLPVTDPKLAEFLKPTDEFTSTNKDVVDRAHEIAGADKDAWSVARKLSEWIHKNLEWRLTAEANPSQTLATREADCSEFSQLFVSMARSLGLPARMVSGIAYGGNSFGGHAWVEVWTGRWVELDPTWGTDYVDATHIRNNTSALISSAALNLIDLEVIEAKRTSAEFQKTASDLTNELVRALAVHDQPTIEAALDLSVLADEFIGPGELEKMNAAENESLTAAFHQAQLEIVFGLDLTSGLKYRLIHLDEKGDRARALVVSPLSDLFMLQLRKRGASWYLIDIEQPKSGLRIIAESLSPAITTIKNHRAGNQTTVSRSDFVRAVLLLNSKPAKAIEIIDAALKSDTANQSLRFLKAKALMKTKQSAEALKLLTELSAEQPVYVPALFALGQELGGSEKPEDRKKAIEIYQRYVALEPFDPTGHRMLAFALSDESQAEQKYVELRKALECDPDSWANYYEVIYFQLTHKREAELDGVFKAADKHPEASEDLFGSMVEELYSEDEPDLAEQLVANQAMRMKGSFLGNLNMGRIQLDKDAPLKALPLLNLAAQIDTKSPEPYISIAGANRALQRWTTGLRATERALQLDPKSADAYYERARILARLGRTTEAMTALTSAIEHNPGWAYSVGDETDFKPLSSLPAYKKILADVEKEKAQAKEPETIKQP